MEIAFILVVFLLLTLVGAPIGVALGVTGVGAIFLFDQSSFGLVGTGFYNGIASVPLLAIPFFVLAGVILQRARLAEKIAQLLELLIGDFGGGMAVVAVLTCMFWGAISGSGPATAAAVGMILIAPMVRHGYSKPFAAAVVANAADLSIIIPPSIAFIIYGNITRTSVPALFMAGVLPGLFMGALLALVAWLVSLRRGYRGTRRRGSAKEIGVAFVKAFPALLAPAIILGGIYSGAFTPTEAAVVAVFYSLFISMALYRTVKFADLTPMMVDAAATSASIMFIVVFAGLFSLAVSTTGLVDAMAKALLALSPNAIVAILLVNVLLLFLGMFLDAISISYLLIPVLLPVMDAFGVDPVWFGVIFITALAIGQTTPPVGVNLFTVASVSGSSPDAVAKEIVPFVAAGMLALLVISLFPALSLWLPRQFGL